MFRLEDRHDSVCPTHRVSPVLGFPLNTYTDSGVRGAREPFAMLPRRQEKANLVPMACGNITFCFSSIESRPVLWRYVANGAYKEQRNFYQMRHRSVERCQLTCYTNRYLGDTETPNPGHHLTTKYRAPRPPSANRNPNVVCPSLSM